MRLRFTGRSPEPFEGPTPPELHLADRLRWQDRNGEWEVELTAPAAHAAHVIASTGLEAMTEDQRVWAPPGARLFDFQLTLREQLAHELEWLGRALAQPEPIKDDGDDGGLRLELSFQCPAVQTLPYAFTRIGRVRLEIDSALGYLAFSTPIEPDELQELLSQGFELRPVDAVMEEFCFGEELLGRLYKPAAPATEPTPFERLHGLQVSLADPFLWKPFPVTLEHAALDETRRLLDQTMAPDQEFLELTSEHRFEVTGIDEQALDQMTAVCFGAAEDLADMVFDDEDRDSSWAECVGLLLSSSLLAGSRVMRALLARAGQDVSLDRALTQREVGTLVSATLAAQDALVDAADGPRGSRVWSLPLAAATVIEHGLLRHLLELEDAEGELEGSQLLLGEMFLLFDLGARYQLARVGRGTLRSSDESAGAAA